MASWIVTRDTAREIEFLIAAFDGDELARTQDDVTAVLSAAAGRYWPWQRTALSNSG